MKLKFAIAAFAASLALSACSGASEDAAGEQVVNLYTARHYDSDKVIYERFTQATGITINFIEGRPDELVARIQAEGANSPADLFITADAGALWRAQQAGLFQPVSSDALSANVPENLREPDGNWYGFTRRARVVAYDSTKVRPEEIADLAALASPRFKGKVCVRSSDSVYNLSLVGALIEDLGAEAANEWVKGVVANMARPPEGGDRDQIRAVAAGVCEVALTNSYYYIRMAHGDDAADREITQTVKLAFPSIAGKGSHVNISGGGVMKNAPNRDNALKLLEFFASPESQAHISQNNFEFPASPDVAVPEPVSAYAGFTPNPMGVAVFAAHQPEAQRMMAEAGWR